MEDKMEAFRKFKQSRLIFNLITFFICAMVILIFLAVKGLDYKNNKAPELKKYEAGRKILSGARFACVQLYHQVDMFFDKYTTDNEEELNQLWSAWMNANYGANWKQLKDSEMKGHLEQFLSVYPQWKHYEGTRICPPSKNDPLKRSVHDFIRDYEKTVAMKDKYEALARKNNQSKDKISTIVKGTEYENLCEKIKVFEPYYRQLKYR